MIIVGGGAAGISAAIEAASAGAHTVVLEAAEAPGGAGALSGGGSLVVDSPLQRSLGVRDSVALALSDWVRWGGAEVDVDWATRYIRESCTEIFAWAQTHGVRWNELQLFEGNSVPRWHWPEGGGAQVMRLLIRAATDRGAEIHVRSPVTELLEADGRIVGVVFERDGRPVTMRSERVIVTTGGYTGSARYVARYGPAVQESGRVLLGGAPSATGSAIAMLGDLDASFRRLDRCWTYPYGTPDDLDAAGLRGIAVRGLLSAIWVNSAGHRFHDGDLSGGVSGTDALLAQDPQTCWCVFDAHEARSLRLVDPKYEDEGAPVRAALDRFLERSPYVARGESLPALAGTLGLPPQALCAEVADFNASVGPSGRPDRFGTVSAELRPIQTPPFHAIQLFPLARKSLGGVRTDPSCRVIRRGGAAIEGLYAAGEVAGMAGGNINGTAALEGTMFGPSVFAGRIAGQRAVEPEADHDSERR